MREVKISMRYPGSVISVNHYKYKGRYTKREARDFMEALGWMVKPHHLEEWRLPLSVRCDGVFRDKRSCPDLSNLAKICLDAIEDTCGVNDQNYRWQDGDILIRKDEKPTLLITIKENDETLLSR